MQYSLISLNDVECPCLTSFIFIVHAHNHRRPSSSFYYSISPLHNADESEIFKVRKKMKCLHTAALMLLIWISSPLLLIVYLISKDPKKNHHHAMNSFLAVFFFIRAYILKMYEQENERGRENKILAHVCSKFMASVLKKRMCLLVLFCMHCALI